MKKVDHHLAANLLVRYDDISITTIIFIHISLADLTGSNTQITKKRKKRFGDENDRVFLPNMPTTISATTMSEQQQKIYVCK